MFTYFELYTGEAGAAGDAAAGAADATHPARLACRREASCEGDAPSGPSVNKNMFK